MNSIKNLTKFKELALRTSQSCSCKSNGHQIRYYSDDRFEKEKKRIEIYQNVVSQLNHSHYVKQFGMPNLRNRLFSGLYVNYRMPSIDPKFNKDQFIEECKEASIVFCNMVSNFKEDQGSNVRDLMTEKAYRKLQDDFENVTDEFLEKLKINEHNIRYHNLIFMRDFKKDDKLFVEATFSILKKPNIFDEDKGVKVSTQISDLILIRYLRDYTDGENSKTDWLISYFEPKFVRKVNFEELSDMFNFKK